MGIATTGCSRIRSEAGTLVVIVPIVIFPIHPNTIDDLGTRIERAHFNLQSKGAPILTAGLAGGDLWLSESEDPEWTKMRLGCMSDENECKPHQNISNHRFINII